MTISELLTVTEGVKEIAVFSSQDDMIAYQNADEGKYIASFFDDVEIQSIWPNKDGLEVYVYDI